MTNQIILFKTEEQDYPFEIIDKDGQKWITRKHLANALGVKDLEPLHRRLAGRKEIKEGVHWSSTAISTGNPKGGNPNVIIYSYRGAIRISMASKGKRAVVFRDWAEDVLYEVMTTGVYKGRYQSPIWTPAERTLMEIEDKKTELEGILYLMKHPMSYRYGNNPLYVTGGVIYRKEKSVKSFSYIPTAVKYLSSVDSLTDYSLHYYDDKELVAMSADSFMSKYGVDAKGKSVKQIGFEILSKIFIE